jgi:hypothetical protein
LLSSPVTSTKRHYGHKIIEETLDGWICQGGGDGPGDSKFDGKKFNRGENQSLRQYRSPDDVIFNPEGSRIGRIYLEMLA